MATIDDDALIRASACRQVRMLQELHGPLTAQHLRAGFMHGGERLPLINPQRGIFKPQRMRYLLSIRTVYPRAGARIWYDDQRRVHQQVYEAEEAVDYAFMGTDPNAADNQWLKQACDTQTPSSTFWGCHPGTTRPCCQRSSAAGTRHA